MIQVQLRTESDFSLGPRDIGLPCSSTVWPTGSWIHRDFHSCAPVFISNGVIPEKILTYCPLRDSDDIFTCFYLLFNK